MVENTRKSTLERFLAKIEITPDGCWHWLGSCNWKGYPRFSINGNPNVAGHRYIYEQSRGIIPEGKQIDHLCRNRSCVNPDHMELVTNRINTLRGFGPTAINARKTHCIHGHLYDLFNTIINKNGERGCRECKRIRRRRLYIKRVRNTKGSPFYGNQYRSALQAGSTFSSDNSPGALTPGL